MPSSDSDPNLNNVAPSAAERGQQQSKQKSRFFRVKKSFRRTETLCGGQKKCVAVKKIAADRKSFRWTKKIYGGQKVFGGQRKVCGEQKKFAVDIKSSRLTKILLGGQKNCEADKNFCGGHKKVGGAHRPIGDMISTAKKCDSPLKKLRKLFRDRFYESPFRPKLFRQLFSLKSLKSFSFYPLPKFWTDFNQKTRNINLYYLVVQILRYFYNKRSQLHN
jgi:hypothetical protein